ncbi:hypothetical protein DV736_g251, partial [Chaetothyriales sp. CBS 134916]
MAVIGSAHGLNEDDLTYSKRSSGSSSESILQAAPSIGIDHVGSTSVGSLAARPVIDIDIDIIARDDLQFNAVKNALTANVLGGYYKYRGPGCSTEVCLPSAGHQHYRIKKEP